MFAHPSGPVFAPQKWNRNVHSVNFSERSWRPFFGVNSSSKKPASITRSTFAAAEVDLKVWSIAGKSSSSVASCGRERMELCISSEDDDDDDPGGAIFGSAEKNIEVAFLGVLCTDCGVELWNFDSGEYWVWLVWENVFFHTFFVDLFEKIDAVLFWSLQIWS